MLRVDGGRATLLASLPPSVAAFHLAFGPDERLAVTATDDEPEGSRVSDFDGERDVEVFYEGFGRPQGWRSMTWATCSSSTPSPGWATYRLPVDRPRRPSPGHREPVTDRLLDPRGGLVLVSQDTAYRPQRACSWPPLAGCRLTRMNQLFARPSPSSSPTLPVFETRRWAPR